MSIKRISAFVFVLLFAITAFAGDTQRYIVAMKPGRLVQKAADLPVLVVAPTESGSSTAEVVGSNVEYMQYLDAYAADMTPVEADALRRSPDVRYVEKSTLMRALGDAAPPVATPAAAVAQSTPWGINAVKAPTVWPTVNGTPINVAILDTGIDYNHPDLKANYAGGLNETVASTDPKRNDPLDDAGHGTHVSGTIAAADDGQGVVGVAPTAKLWAVKVLGADGKGGIDKIAAGINWIIGKKAELGGDWVINMSLGQCTDPTNTDCSTQAPLILQEACQKASDAGILIVAAAGNESSVDPATGAVHIAPVGYPAAFPTVMAVGAVDAALKIADFSSQGPEMEISAPGVAIRSSYPVGQGSNSTVSMSDGGFEAIPLQGSLKGRVTATMVDCGLGKTGQFPAAVNGNIALIGRGEITFNEKVRNAKAAGAVGAIVYNNIDGLFNGTMLRDGNSDDLTFPWPVSLSISKADGATLVSKAGQSVTLVNETGDFTYMQGTSMATPHVAGGAALVWSADPTAKASAVRSALTSSAKDLGTAGHDNVYGYGMIDTYAAAKALAPWKFGSGGTPAPTVISFRATPSTITAGQSTTLSWTTTEATSATIDNVGSFATNGSSVVTPAATTIYTLRVTGPSGAAMATVTVTVNQPPQSPNGRRTLRRR